jgi:hypothetical protein
MNYIWDILLKADGQNIPRKNLKFVQAQIRSPYMELAFDELNAVSLPEDNIIEVNECYRFYEVFKDLFNINVNESRELREVLLDILLHYLGELDFKKGLCKTEFYKKFLMRDMLNGVFGEKIAESINCLEKDERDTFFYGIITLYKTGFSIELFKNIIRKIYKNSIVYSNNEQPKHMFIYLDEVKTEKNEKKIELIIDTFLSIEMKPYVFWDKHFGILGLDYTMKINETVMVE